MVQKTKEGEIGEEHLLTFYDPDTGPKIPEWQVEFCKQEIDHRCKSPAQKAAALQALEARDFDTYHAIMSSLKQGDGSATRHGEVGL